MATRTDSSVCTIRRPISLPKPDEQNWIRTIVDVGYQPVPLLPAVSFADGQPLDLSGAALRSVSPIHIEYLTNMGVTASMSISLIVHGRLWGLIACHHYSGPLHPSARVRTAAEFLGQVASTALSHQATLAANSADRRLTAIVDGIAEALITSQASVRDTFLAQGTQVLGVASATSAAVVVGGEVWTIGDPPDVDVLNAIRKHAEASTMPWTTDQLHTAIGQLDDERDGRHAGALACQLSPAWEDLIVWFREEQVRDVDWGGDPHNAKLHADDERGGVRLSPRKSFDRWREVVRHTSRPWEEPVVRNAGRCAFKLAGALLREERSTRALTDQLQAMIRPSGTARPENYELDMWYQPAEHGQVGGDWFDVVDLDGGDFALVVGDVAGHGVRAAAEMTQLRYMLRAYLLVEHSPAEVLSMLDRAIEATMPGTLATCVCAVVQRDSGRVAISHAGHIPALIARPGRDSEFAATAGDILLGLGASRRHEVVLDLEVGDLVVLYSDGLVERRDHPLDADLQRLAELAGSFSSETDLHVITEALLDLHHTTREDDVCVLSVRRRQR